MLKSISSEEVKKLLAENANNENLVILDIRTEREFLSGAVPGAINMDFYEPDFFGKLGELDKKKKYLIYCRSGNRSKGALEMMEKLGFEEVYELDHGIISL